ELLDAATRAAAAYQGALGFLRPVHPRWRPPVLTCSATTGAGVAEVWAAVERYRQALSAAGDLAARRAGQARAWMWSEVSETVLARLRAHPEVAGQLAELEAAVMAGTVTPAAAARRLVRAFLGH
ncbi:MAG TPA: methylmalonyl Co-A mutase-associated GTPase MeaB, partial [Kiloniellales bacterium]